MIHEDQIVSVPKVPGDHVDPDRALEILQERFPPHRGPRGYVMGRTVLRNTVAEQTGCSLVRAEQLILELNGTGRIVFGRVPGELETAPGFWTVSPN